MTACDGNENGGEGASTDGGNTETVLDSGAGDKNEDSVTDTDTETEGLHVERTFVDGIYEICGEAEVIYFDSNGDGICDNCGAIA